MVYRRYSRYSDWIPVVFWYSGGNSEVLAGIRPVFECCFSGIQGLQLYGIQVVSLILWRNVHGICGIQLHAFRRYFIGIQVILVEFRWYSGGIYVVFKRHSNGILAAFKIFDRYSDSILGIMVVFLWYWRYSTGISTAISTQIACAVPNYANHKATEAHVNTNSSCQIYIQAKWKWCCRNFIISI